MRGPNSRTQRSPPRPRQQPVVSGRSEIVVRIHLLSALTAASLTAVMSFAGAATAAAPEGSTCPLPTFGPGAAYHPTIDPTTFTAEVDNPWFPLPVGTTFVYAGVEEGQKALDRVTPAATTRRIDGVAARVVQDRLYLDGALAERTSDYFAQDRCGNVWYFGEDTAELGPHGEVVSRDGTWHAGIHGAEPGVVMQARPELGLRFRQEWLAGQAEDVFRVVDLCAPAAAEGRSFSCALQTEEVSALEPGVIDGKYYARGIGEVEERTVTGPTERLVLVDVQD